MIKDFINYAAKGVCLELEYSREISDKMLAANETGNLNSFDYTTIKENLIPNMDGHLRSYDELRDIGVKFSNKTKIISEEIRKNVVRLEKILEAQNE